MIYHQRRTGLVHEEITDRHVILQRKTLLLRDITGYTIQRLRAQDIVGGVLLLFLWPILLLFVILYLAKDLRWLIIHTAQGDRCFQLAKRFRDPIVDALTRALADRDGANDIHFSCPHCSERLVATPPDGPGTRLNCPACSKLLTVPGNAPPPSPSRDERRPPPLPPPRQAGASGADSSRDSPGRRAEAKTATVPAHLLAQLRSPKNDKEKKESLEKLGRIGTPEAAAETIRVLNETLHNWVGHDYLLPGMLARFGPSAVPPFCEALGVVPYSLAEALSQALADIAKSFRVRVETDLDTERYFAVRKRLTGSSETLCAPSRTELLRHKLAQAYQDGRRQAADELSTLGEPLWKTLVQGDDGDFARIAESNDPKALEILLAGLDSGNVRTAAALARLGEAGIKHLLDALARPCLDTRRILEALDGDLTDRGRTVLSAMIENEEVGEDCMTAIATMLGKNANQESIQLLERVVNDENKPYSVKMAASDALAEHGIAATVRFKREDWSPDAYLRAILQLGPKDNPERLGAAMRQNQALLREYGEEIEHKAGFSGMQQVCTAVRDQAGPAAGRLLEMMWDGIGIWRG